MIGGRWSHAMSDWRARPLLSFRTRYDLLKAGGRDPSRPFKMGLPTDPCLSWMFVWILEQDFSDAIPPINHVLLRTQQSRVGRKMLPVVKGDHLGPFRSFGHDGIANRRWLLAPRLVRKGFVGR
jgi:hypothetical protein